MKSKFSLSLICLLLFISVIGTSFYMYEFYPQEKRKIYYLPSLDYLKLISGTYRSLFAQMFFIKGVQEITEEIPDRMSYLLELFKTVVYLDSKLISAYFFGGVILPTRKEDMPLGIKFLKEGMLLNPWEWRIPFWIGLNYLQLGIYSKVIEYYKIASGLPNSPAYLKSNLAYFYYKAENPKEGILYLETLLRTIQDQRLLKIMKKKIEWLKGLALLEDKIEEYRRIYGVWPDDLKELVEKGLLDKIPQDSFGGGYYLEKDLLGGIPKVRSRFEM